MWACCCGGISTACNNDLVHCKILCQRTSRKGAYALAGIHPASQNSHSGALDTRRCSRKHPPSPKKMHSGALDTFGAECQITYAQCVLFISTHKCGCVAVKESVQHVMMIWCIAKDCAEGRLSQASIQSQKIALWCPCRVSLDRGLFLFQRITYPWMKYTK